MTCPCVYRRGKTYPQPPTAAMSFALLLDSAHDLIHVKEASLVPLVLPYHLDQASMYR